MEKNVYTYSSQLPLFALACNDSPNEDGSFDIALGTCVSEYSNRVEIVSYSRETDSLCLRASFQHLYPPTSVVYEPPGGASMAETGTLLATSGEYIRLWLVSSKEDSQSMLFQQQQQGNMGPDKFSAAPGTDAVSLVSVFNPGTTRNVKSCSPFTSMDWNCFNKELLVGGSADSACSIFDIQKQAQVSRLFLSHTTDQRQNTPLQVYDVSFSSQNRYVTAIACSEGLVQLMDYRTDRVVSRFRPFASTDNILRTVFNPVRPTILAAVSDGATEKEVSVVDIRAPPGTGMFSTSGGTGFEAGTSNEMRLRRHNGAVNAITWAPHKDSFLCSVSEDCSALIWAVPDFQTAVNEKPLLAYHADSFANNVHWSAVDSSRIGLVFGNCLQLLKV